MSRSTLQCQMCRALVAFLPEEDGSSEDIAIERLKTAHDKGCLWARQTVEESAYRFPIVSPPKIVHCFRIRYEKLIANPSDIPVSEFLHLTEERLAHLDVAGLVNELKLSAHSDAAVTKSSVLLALFGWDLVFVGSHRFLECALCVRRARLWNFSKIVPFSSESADRDLKRMKLTDLPGDSPVLPDFAVWQQHRWYCPWINNVNFKAGWITTLDAVQPLRLRKKAAPAGAAPALAQPSSTRLAQSTVVESPPRADRVLVNDGGEMGLQAAAVTLPVTGQGETSVSSTSSHVSDSEAVARPSARASNVESYQTLPLDVDSMRRSHSIQEVSASPVPSDNDTTRCHASKPITKAPSSRPSTSGTLAASGEQSFDQENLSLLPVQQIFEGHQDEQRQIPVPSGLSRTELVQNNQPSPRAGLDDEMRESNPDPNANYQTYADADRRTSEAHLLCGLVQKQPARTSEAVANEEADEERGRAENAAMDWVNSILQSASSSPLQQISDLDVPVARLVAASNLPPSLSHDIDHMDVDAAAFVHPLAPASVDDDAIGVWDGRTRDAEVRNASDMQNIMHQQVSGDFESDNQALPLPLATLPGTANDSHACEVDETPEGQSSPFMQDAEVTEQTSSRQNNVFTEIHEAASTTVSSNGPSHLPEGSPPAEVPVNSEQSDRPRYRHRHSASDDADEAASLLLVDEESEWSNQHFAAPATDSRYLELTPQLTEPNSNVVPQVESMLSDVDQSIQNKLVSEPDTLDDLPAGDTILPPIEGSENPLRESTEDTSAMDWEPVGGMEGVSTDGDQELPAEMEEPAVTSSVGASRAGSDGITLDADTAYVSVDAASYTVAHEDSSLSFTETTHSVETGSRMEVDDGANDEGEKQNVGAYKATREGALNGGKNADEIEILNELNAEASLDIGRAIESAANFTSNLENEGTDPGDSPAVDDNERATIETEAEMPDDEPVSLMATDAASELAGHPAVDISPPIAIDKPDDNSTERVPSDSFNVEPQLESVVVPPEAIGGRAEPPAHSLEFHAHANPQVAVLDNHDGLMEAEHVVEHDTLTNEGDEASGGLQRGSLAAVVPNIAAASAVHDSEVYSADVHISEINRADYEEGAEGKGDAEHEHHELLVISSQDAEHSSDLSDEVSALPPSPPLEGDSDGSESDKGPYEDKDEDEARLPHFFPNEGKTYGSESDEDPYEDEEESDEEYYEDEYEEQYSKKISNETEVIVIDSDSDDDRDIHKANEADGFDPDGMDDDAAHESFDSEEAHLEGALEVEEHDEEGRERPAFSTEHTVEPFVDECSGPIAEVYDGEAEGDKIPTQQTY
ncbi:hypothetical protein HDU87_003775 [Geranomyces variabilis]|uniref:Uncharacterized protein n=1 Tax=Geranomyces variabilis TaxID=109894 RepID=A0AAD5XR41_9FUNG|nr:hypothetical protein HDU87_003775 [Geranomyces variabilis]